MTTADREPGRSTARLHGLDALRGGALVLGIILHSLMPFLPAGPGFRTTGTAVSPRTPP